MSESLQRYITLEPEADVPPGEKRLYNKSPNKYAKLWKIRPSIYYVEVMAPILHYTGYRNTRGSLEAYMPIVARELNDRFDTDAYKEANCITHFSQLKDEMLTISELIGVHKDAVYDEETGFLVMEEHVYLGYRSGLKGALSHSVTAVLSKNMRDVHMFGDLFRNDVKDQSVKKELDYRYAEFYEKWQKEGYFKGFIHPDDKNYGKVVPNQPQQEQTPAKAEQPRPSSVNKEATTEAEIPSPETTMSDEELEPHPDDGISEEYIYKRTVAIEGLIRLYRAGLLGLGEAVRLGKDVKSAGPEHVREMFQAAPIELLNGILN